MNLVAHKFQSFSNADDDHQMVGPTSKRPIYELIGQTEFDHKILGPAYERSKLKAEYDIHLVEDVINKSKRFNRIKPEALIKILSEHRKYTYLRKFAIERLQQTWLKQLRVIANLSQCEKYDFEPDDELSHTIFSWSWKDFLARRRLKNFVWVDVMQRTTESCLHKYKFHKDLEQLKRYVANIFNCFHSNLNDEEDIDIYQNVEKPIHEAKQVLHTANYLEDELNQNSYTYWQLVQSDTFVGNIRRETEEKFLKTFLQNRIMCSHIWDPIEIRYKLNWYYNIVNQNQYRMDKLHETYHEDSEKYKYLRVRETNIDTSCMDFFYTYTEIYKDRINKLQAKFDAELDAMNTRLDLKRNQIYKLTERRKSYTEDIARFRREEILMAERQQRKFEENQRLRLEAEKLGAQRLSKKTAKEKKKEKSGSPKARK